MEVVVAVLLAALVTLGWVCWRSHKRIRKMQATCKAHWAEVQHRMNNHVARESAKTGLYRQMLVECGVSEQEVDRRRRKLAESEVFEAEYRPPLCEDEGEG
jgi:hypothetical protein